MYRRCLYILIWLIFTQYTMSKIYLLDCENTEIFLSKSKDSYWSDLASVAPSPTTQSFPQCLNRSSLIQKLNLTQQEPVETCPNTRPKLFLTGWFDLLMVQYFGIILTYPQIFYLRKQVLWLINHCCLICWIKSTQWGGDQKFD